jgi:ubiquinone biosynthesis protein COQ4
MIGSIAPGLPARPRTSRPLPSPWTRARQAWISLRALMRSPEDTGRVFEFLRALDPRRAQRFVAMLASSRSGRRLLEQRPLLLRVLGDRAWLESLPDGSFGRAYLQHMDRFALDPSGLVYLQREFDPSWAEGDETERWWLDRGALVHDLWHVLTGCGADRLGEARLLPFTFAQVGGLPNAALLLALALRPAPSVWLLWWRDLWLSFASGRRAAELIPVAYEELLDQPLDVVRRSLGIEPLPPAPPILQEVTAAPVPAAVPATR